MSLSWKSPLCKKIKSKFQLVSANFRLQYLILGFLTFWWYDWSYDFILKFSRLICQSQTKVFVLKILFQALYLEIIPLKSNMGV